MSSSGKHHRFGIGYAVSDLHVDSRTLFLQKRSHGVREDFMMGKGLSPLFSTFIEEPAIAEILPIFLQNLPSYLRRIEDAIAVGDFDVAARTCHDLKGAAGGYGYPSISALASSLEVSLRVGDFGGEVKELLETLRELCQRAAKGMESLG